MWKEYNRRNKYIKNRWRSRYKEHNRRGNAIKWIVLAAVIVALLVGLIIYACFCIRDLSAGEEDTPAANIDYLASVEMPQATPSPSPEPVVTKEPCVVLDAGHGGIDGGTFVDDIIEKNINLAVVQYIKEILEENDIKVELTRENDEQVEIHERPVIANDLEASLFVSIHCNAFDDDDSVSGLECYYCPEKNDGSEKIAGTFIRVLKENENIKVRSAKTADYYVLKYTDMPSVLVEMGFLTSKTEREKLNSESYQKILAEEMAEAIMLTMEDLEKAAEKEQAEEANKSAETEQPGSTP